MTLQHLESTITEAWEIRDLITPTSHPGLLVAVQQVYEALSQGLIRVAEPTEGHAWHTHAWIKQAILLSFRLFPNQVMPHGATVAHDKIPLHFQGWDQDTWAQSQARAVPGAVVRYGAYIGPNVILMPSFVNVGAYVGKSTMIDTWATVGSCAQIGEHCHISGGTGIGGVLEPLQSNPVIIEDNCFIGARSEIAEGVIVESGSVISMGVFIGVSTKIVHRQTGEITYGRVPAYSVVVPGTLPPPDGKGPHLAAAIIIKTVDERTRAKTSLTDLLRP